MDEIRILLSIIFLIVSLCIGMYTWLYMRKAHDITSSLQMAMPMKLASLLRISFFLALFTIIVSVAVIIIELIW